MDNFVFAREPLAKATRSLEFCVPVNNKLFRKIVSSLESPTTFDERFKITSVPFLIPDFRLLSYKLENLTFELLYWVTLYWYYIKEKNCNIPTGPCKKPNIVPFASSIYSRFFLDSL